MSLAHVLASRYVGCVPAATETVQSTGEILMQSQIQIFKLDEVKKGTSKKTGNPYEIHSAQAALIDSAGNVDTVGVLDIPPDLRGKVTPGLYTGSFAMKTNFSSGRIEAVLTGLTPLPRSARAPAPASLDQPK